MILVATSIVLLLKLVRLIKGNFRGEKQRSFEKKRCWQKRDSWWQRDAEHFKPEKKN